MSILNRVVLDEMFKQIQLFGRPFFYTLQKCLWGLRPDFRVKALNKTLGMHALTAIAKQTDLCVYVCSFLYSQNEAGTLWGNSGSRKQLSSKMWQPLI